MPANENGQIQTGLRISESLNDRIETIAADCDLSKNSTIKMLIGLGMQAYNNVTSQAQSPRALPRTDK